MVSRMLRKTSWELKFRPDLGEIFWITSKGSWPGWSSSGFFCCPIFFSLRATNKGEKRRGLKCYNLIHDNECLCYFVTQLSLRPGIQSPVHQTCMCFANDINTKENKQQKVRCLTPSAQVWHLWLICGLWNPASPCPGDFFKTCVWSHDWFSAFDFKIFYCSIGPIIAKCSSDERITLSKKLSQS